MPFATLFSTPGGNSTQSFLPRITVFHALVPSGSICTDVPERLGPTRNHLLILMFQLERQGSLALYIHLEVQPAAVANREKQTGFAASSPPCLYMCRMGGDTRANFKSICEDGIQPTLFIVTRQIQSAARLAVAQHGILTALISN